MNRSTLRRLAILSTPLAGALLAAGCSLPKEPIARGQMASALTAPVAQVHQVAHHTADAPPAEMLPPPGAVKNVSAQRVVPIALDTVLRLAEEQNTQVAQAREQLNESQIEKCLADLSWLPCLNVGMAYFRHEGGIQNEDGTQITSSFGSAFPGLDMTARMDLKETLYQRISAERKVWQQQGELSRVTSDVLLEASSTYIDLLTARTSEAVMRRMEVYEKDMLKWAEATQKAEGKSAQALVENVKTVLAGREQSIRQARLQGDAASAKLAYLLGMGPDVLLEPVEASLTPITLVDADQPTEALVARALSAGPAVRELEQMVAVIQEGIDRANGPGKFLPVFEMKMIEGDFGAGPNSSMSWANRWDMGVQVKWDVAQLFTARDKMRQAESRLRQAELAHRDLQGKLTLGVQESQQAVQGNRKVISLSSDQVKHAMESYKLSDLRLKERIMGSSAAEVLSAIHVLELSQMASLNAIRAHNKAQVRLMVLMGAAAEPHHK